MYGWNPGYLLDYLTIEEVFLFYDEGLKFEEYRTGLIIYKLGEALTDPKDREKAASPQQSDKPDKAKFYKHYGNKIKRPPKEGE